MTRPPRHVGIFGNREKAEVRSLVPALSRWIQKQGIQVSLEAGITRGRGLTLASLVKKVDVLLVLGGDGTMLHAARAAAQAGVPIFGINLGGLGFLTETSEDQLYPALERLFRGDVHTERRLMVEARVKSRSGRTWSAVGLNDAVIHARDRSRVVAIDVRVGPTPIGTLVADGLIVATPTGSTAYSLSAGGPIVLPTVSAIVVTAISPHTLAVRPLVVPSTSVVTVEPIPPWTEDIMVSLDGQVGTPIHPGERLLVKRAERPVLLIRLGPEGFFARMRDKLKWGDLSDRERV